MNAVKQVVRDTGKTVGNLGVVAAGLTLVTSGELVKLSGAIAEGVKAVPEIITATFHVPKAAVIGYIREDRGVDRAEAVKIVDEMFPESIAQALESGSEACGVLFATMMKDDEADTKK